MFDILIKNGTVIDGTGAPMFRGDVGIRDEKIDKVGDLSNEKGEIEIDATDKFVCPGFVDVNNHSDTYWRIFLNPDLESLVYQGITTIVGGNCGTSLAPLRTPETIASIQKWVDLRKVTVNWLSLPEFFKILEKKPLAVNFATLIGHATLRRSFLEDDTRSLTADELTAMDKLLSSSLKKGGLGISTGLIYTHAKLASSEELVNLAQVAKENKKVYATHIRGEKDELIRSIEEAISIGEKTKVKLHISHLKAMGEKNWSLMDEALALIERAKESGQDITFDVYPYTHTGSVLYTLLPDWVSEGGRKSMLARLKDLSVRAKAVEEMKESGFDYSKIEIAISPINKTLARKKISEIAASQNKSVEEAIIDVLLASEGQVVASMEVLSQENVDKAVTHPLSIIASNGSGYNLEHASSGERVHPRSFGTFPKVLRDYVVERKLLTWEEAIYKMTWRPAEKFGIVKRGQIKKDFFADVLVFDREAIRDLSNKENPYQYSQGIIFSLVNGRIVLSEGKYLGKKVGEILKF